MRIHDPFTACDVIIFNSQEEIFQNIPASLAESCLYPDDEIFALFQAGQKGKDEPCHVDRKIPIQSGSTTYLPS